MVLSAEDPKIQDPGSKVAPPPPTLGGSWVLDSGFWILDLKENLPSLVCFGLKIQALRSQPPVGGHADRSVTDTVIYTLTEPNMEASTYTHVQGDRSGRGIQ